MCKRHVLTPRIEYRAANEIKRLSTPSYCTCPILCIAYLTRNFLHQPSRRERDPQPDHIRSCPRPASGRLCRSHHRRHARPRSPPPSWRRVPPHVTRPRGLPRSTPTFESPCRSAVASIAAQAQNTRYWRILASRRHPRFRASRGDRDARVHAHAPPARAGLGPRPAPLPWRGGVGRAPDDQACHGRRRHRRSHPETPGSASLWKRGATSIPEDRSALAVAVAGSTRALCVSQI